MQKDASFSSLTYECVCSRSHCNIYELSTKKQAYKITMCTIFKMSTFQNTILTHTQRRRQTDRQTQTHTRHSIITTWLTIFRSPRNRYVVDGEYVSRYWVQNTWIRHFSFIHSVILSLSLFALHLGVHLAWWACMILPFIFYFTRFFARCAFMQVVFFFLSSSSFIVHACWLSFLPFESVSHFICAHSDHSEKERGIKRQSAVVILSFSVESCRWFCFSHCFAYTCEYHQVNVVVSTIRCKMMKYKYIYRYIWWNQTTITTSLYAI